MIELEADQFDRVSPIVSGLRRFVHLNAVINRDNAGRVFVDHAENPALVLIWTRWGYFYLAGHAHDDRVTESLRVLLSQTLIPDSVAGGERDLALIPYLGSWESRLDSVLEDKELIKLFRRAFVFNPSSPDKRRGAAYRLPVGFCLKRIDEELAAQMGGILLTWDSIADFLDRGFGFCVLYNKVIVSECFTAFVSDGCVEISVSTAPSYRRQGLALLVAETFIGHCLDNDLTPNWECWWDNVPSCACLLYTSDAADESSRV